MRPMLGVVTPAIGRNPAAPPQMAAAGGPGDAPEEDVLDPDNPPYPLHQDLRPAGTFPLPGEGEGADERPAPSPRREFLGAAPQPAVWSSTTGLYSFPLARSHRLSVVLTVSPTFLIPSSPDSNTTATLFPTIRGSGGPELPRM